ncbi:NAD(P)/FAD-dependent oxidoreductase [Jiella pacifica]|uniref:Thioredoxin reductase n=1 Tax=Jiella pacifica TaxID=2696469 RepID=A0A6N9T479_9HYPH|nr:NAD(P)/FAD-dependent oxidoreductase [Jiella pacifica]NDW06060.1 FAD-dependent oxidoreductase [Jiella pacifica]
MHDVIVVGGSYAGLAAALQLARARRDVVVIDAGLRRNRFASHSHGFLGQDGRDPAAIVAEARQQIAAYPNVTFVDGRATRIERPGADFAVCVEKKQSFLSRRLVLALGVVDYLPDVPGLAERWGKHVFHCPYCHGYELNAGAIGVLATGPVSMHHALMLPDWGTVTFFLNGAFEPSPEERARLAARGVAIEATGVARIAGEADVVLTDGRTLAMAGLFTASRIHPSCGLAEGLGCGVEEGPTGRFLRTDAMQETTVAGIFACGDVARAAGSVSLAVGDGAMTGTAVHRSLMFG